MTILTEPVGTLPHFDSFLAKSKVPQGQTDELLTWLSKVNQKKAAIKSTRNRDLRKEAMLEASRQYAQNALESKQRERLARWRDMMRIWTPSTQEPQMYQTDNSICDCESCFLCKRHKPEMHGKCYCNVIFSPRPVFMDFHSIESGRGYNDDKESMEVDKFLASLDSCVPPKKRKYIDIEEDDDLIGRKRATA